MDKDLQKIQKSIPHFFSYFKSPNILAISESKEYLPFIIIIKDINYKHHILLSVAVDCPSADKAVEIALWCSKVKPTALTETFYISKNGITYTGEESYKYYELDKVLLEKIIPITDIEH